MIFGWVPTARVNSRAAWPANGFCSFYHAAIHRQQLEFRREAVILGRAMNLETPLSCLILMIAVMTSPAAGDTNQPALSNAPHGGFHQKIPWAVGTGMEGTITNIAVSDHRISFQLTGWFWLTQYPEGGTNVQIIKVDCRCGIPATVNQPDSFVAMTSDWSGGSVQNGKGKLLKLLQTAAERSTVVKFSLMKPKVDLGGDRSFTLIDADVWRVTDTDLR